MAGWEVEYNGFGNWSGADDWTTISIKSYVMEPEIDDTGSLITSHHRLVGTAVIAQSTAALLKAKIDSARELLTEPGKKLIVTNSTLAAENELVNLEEGDDDKPGYPRVTFEITKIIGVISAIVSFQIDWNELLDPQDDNEASDILSHSWEYDFDYAEHGRAVVTITGTLVTKNKAVEAVGETPVERGVNPDVYRRLIVPDLPDAEGFRLTRQRWGIDETGRRLAYSLVFTEYWNNLPAPARKGEGRFTFSRSLDTGTGFLGRKMFEATLEGDTQSNPGEMLAQLTQCALNRITFSGPKLDRIMSIEVTEDDFFNSNKVGLKIVAHGLPVEDGPTVFGFPNYSFLRRITQNTTPYEVPDPYGSAQIRAIAKRLFQRDVDYAIGDPTVDGKFPRAGFEESELSDNEPSNPYGEFVMPSATVGEIPAGPYVPQGDEFVSDEHQLKPYMGVAVVERVVNLDNGFVILSAADIDSNDFPMQVRKPWVEIESMVTVSRHDSPPGRMLLAMPPGSLKLSESYELTEGEIDANNNRTYVAKYTRRIRLYDRVGGGNGFVTSSLTIPGQGQGGHGASVTVIDWQVPFGSLRLPLDPRTDGEGHTVVETIFEFADAGRAFPVYDISPAIT